MDLVDLINTRSFLGSEFLLWLWFRSECFDSLLYHEAHGGLEVWIDDKLTLEAYLAETERNDFKGGSPAFSPEAKTALRQGKRPSRAKIHVVKEGREWTFTLKAETMDLGGLKIPALLTREEDEQFYERMFLLEEIEDVLLALYGDFMAIRLSEEVWDGAMLPAIRAWIASDELVQPEAYPRELVSQKLGIETHPSIKPDA